MLNILKYIGKQLDIQKRVQKVDCPLKRFRHFKQRRIGRRPSGSIVGRVHASTRNALPNNM